MRRYHLKIYARNKNVLYQDLIYTFLNQQSQQTHHAMPNPKQTHPEYKSPMTKSNDNFNTNILKIVTKSGAHFMPFTPFIVFFFDE